MDNLIWGAGGVALTLVGVLGKVWVAKIRSGNGHRRFVNMRPECSDEFKTIHGSLAQGNQKFADHDRRLDKVENKDDIVVQEIQQVALDLSTKIGAVGERIARLEGPSR